MQRGRSPSFELFQLDMYEIDAYIPQSSPLCFNTINPLI